MKCKPWGWQLSLSLFWNMVVHHSTIVAIITVFILKHGNYKGVVTYYTTSANHDGFLQKTLWVWSYASFYDGAKHHCLCFQTLKWRKHHRLLYYDGLGGPTSYVCHKKAFFSSVATLVQLPPSMIKEHKTSSSYFPMENPISTCLFMVILPSSLSHWSL